MWEWAKAQEQRDACTEPLVWEKSSLLICWECICAGSGRGLCCRSLKWDDGLALLNTLNCIKHTIQLRALRSFRCLRWGEGPLTTPFNARAGSWPEICECLSKPAHFPKDARTKQWRTWMLLDKLAALIVNWCGIFQWQILSRGQNNIHNLSKKYFKNSLKYSSINTTLRFKID